jgi:hypothetical protein
MADTMTASAPGAGVAYTQQAKALLKPHRVSKFRQQVKLITTLLL